MHFFTVIRILAAVAVLSFFAGTMVVAKRFFTEGEVEKAPENRLEALIPTKPASEEMIDALVARLEVENIPDVTPGERAFESARDLLEKGDYLAAEEKLKYVNTYYPTAPSAPEARRILGEMNMDRLFQGKAFAKHGRYTVQSGDSFFKIIREQETNLDLLMLLNGLDRTDRLHPGDEFIVMPLNFRILIDLQRQTVSLWNGPQFIKAYAIEQSAMPPGNATMLTKISAVEALSGGGRVRQTSDAYRDAHKLVVLKKPQVELRASDDPELEGFIGLTLAPADMEELALLVRAGNSAEIRY